MSNENETKHPTASGPAVGSRDLLCGPHSDVAQLLAAWDSGRTIWSIELGGLGPGYEQAIQIAAVEFARAGKDLPNMKNDDRDSTERFTACCEAKLKEIDEKILGLSGAQFGAARWLAWQWCFNGGPKALQDRLREKGEDDRAIQVSKAWPQAA